MMIAEVDDRNHDHIRVLIVDDHSMFRRGLEIALTVEVDLEVVGETNDGIDVVRLCEDMQPDVILMDMVMPEMDGVTATRLIHERFPMTKIIALSSFAEEAMVSNVLQAGAVGYLIKDISSRDLIQAIRAAMAGRVTLSPGATEALVRAAARSAPPDYGLTAREIEVFRALKDGLHNNEIAERLFISPATVKHHISSILNKLQVSSRMEAVALATRNNLYS